MQTVSQLLYYLKDNPNILFQGFVNGMMVAEDRRTFINGSESTLEMMSGTGRTIRINLVGVNVLINETGFTLTNYKPYDRIVCQFKGMNDGNRN